jgi:hypothetical protein
MAFDAVEGVIATLHEDSAIGAPEGLYARENVDGLRVEMLMYDEAKRTQPLLKNLFDKFCFAYDNGGERAMRSINRNIPNLVSALCNQGPKDQKYVAPFKTTPGYIPTCLSCCVPAGSMVHYIFVLDEHIETAVRGAFGEVFPRLNFDEVKKTEEQLSKTDRQLLDALKGRSR